MSRRRLRTCASRRQEIPPVWLESRRFAQRSIGRTRPKGRRPTGRWEKQKRLYRAPLRPEPVDHRVVRHGAGIEPAQPVPGVCFSYQLELELHAGRVAFEHLIGTRSCSENRPRP